MFTETLSETPEERGPFRDIYWKGGVNNTNPKEMGFKDMDWVYLVHDKEQS
jgi:hypothetical protein